MTDVPAFIAETFRRSFGRPPEEHELSFYLHRSLIEGVPLPVLRNEILLAGNDPAPPSSNLMELDGEAFVRMAWRSLAGREPDDGELARAHDRLLSGELSKRGLLRELGAPATGREKMFETPVIGRLLRIAALIWHLPAVERDIAALRHRVADIETAATNARKP